MQPFVQLFGATYLPCEGKEKNEPIFSIERISISHDRDRNAVFMFFVETKRKKPGAWDPFIAQTSP